MRFPRKVYAIQHNVTKRIYIGSSCNVTTRYQNHMFALRRGKHVIEDMQEDFDKYGEDYSLFILDECFSSSDKNKEYEWMLKYNSFVRGIGYNYKDHTKTRLAGTMKNCLPYREGLPTQYAEHTEASKKQRKDDLATFIKFLDESQIDKIIERLPEIVKD